MKSKIASRELHPRTIKFRLEMFLNGDHEKFSTLFSSRLRSKVINLLADKDRMTMNSTMIEITLMSGIAKLEDIVENVGDHPIPKYTSLWMALESLVQGNDLLETVQLLTKTSKIPVLNLIINSQEAGYAWWR